MSCVLEYKVLICSPGRCLVPVRQPSKHTQPPDLISLVTRQHEGFIALADSFMSYIVEQGKKGGTDKKIC